MHGSVTDVTNAYMNDVFIEHNRIALDAGQQSADVFHCEVTDSHEGALEESIGLDWTEIHSAAASLDGGMVLNVRSKQPRNSKGQVVDRLEQGESFSLEFDIEILRSVRNISVGVLIKDQFGQELTGESYFNTHRHSLDFAGGRTVRYVFKSHMLLRGGQSYSVALRVNQVSKWDRTDNVVVYTDELAMVFDVLVDVDNPMWFKFKMPFEVSCQ